MVNCLLFAICYFRPPEKWWWLQNFCSIKKWMMLAIVDGNVFKVLTLSNNLVIICVLLTLHDLWKMCVFSAKIWFVKTLTRIVKYESRVIKSNPTGEYSTYGTYGGAAFQLGDFGDLDTASKGYKNSKSVPGRVMIFETFEKFFKVRINFWESFKNLESHIPVSRSLLKSVFHAHASPHPDPCARVKCFQIIFSWLEPRICYDLGKWRAIRPGVIDLLAWVAC